MNSMNELAEQHILESESRLRHIDEMLAKARQALPQPAEASPTTALLEKVQSERDRIAQDLEALRRAPAAAGPELVQRSQGLKGVLEAVGEQMEKILMSVLESRS